MIQKAVYSAGLLLLLFSSQGLAQQYSVPVDTTVVISEPDSTYLLHQWIEESSVTVTFNDSVLRPEEWYLNYREGTWRLRNPDRWDTDITEVHFSYRYFPLGLQPRYFRRELVRPEDPEEDDEVLVARDPVTEADLFGDTQLQRSGSLSRGITVGSARDFSLESGLRFELSGDITEDVNVQASLTDQNTPIQPEGTTQRIQEFDQVLIQLNAGPQSLQLGDVDVNFEESDFAVINRRLQGVDMSTTFGMYGDYDAAAAVVRGQFRSQQFDGEDGIQGPYRLSGNQGERFIIVLAGSERVYVDGQRVERGEENDYIIDYGLGEINFTSNQIITDASRITVEFQYRTEEYTRTLLGAEAGNAELLDGRLQIGASFIREADNINLSTQLQLSEEDLNLLRETGDDPDGAIVHGADSVGFSEDTDFVLYTRKDTVINGETYEIYENRPGDPDGIYRVRFSRVEEGEGSYRRAGRSVNGIVYEWVGPGQGSYEPFRRLNPPREQSMIALRSSFRPNNSLEFFGEWAGSETDLNRLSPLDDADNFDNSYLIGMGLNDITIPIGDITAGIRHRYIGRNFSFFDRGREVEFERRWNIGRQRQDVKERTTEGVLDWRLTENSEIDLMAGIINRDDVTGNRQEVNVYSAEEGLPFLSLRGERVESEDHPLDEQGVWYRQRGELGYDYRIGAGTLTPAIGIEAEDRRQRYVAEDTLTHNSFRFYDVKPELRYSLETITMTAGLSYRRDQRVLSDNFENEAYGITQQYSVNWTPHDRFRTENRFSFRSRTFEEVFRIEEQREDSRGILLHSVTNYRSPNRLFDTRFQYEANTERRPIMEETFIEVGPEMGEYVWEDTRDDGVKHIDEFFPQQSPNEGTYIRQFVPSDELFPVVRLRTTLRNTMDPSVIITSPENDLQTLLQGMRLHSTVEIREENRTEEIADIYLLNINEFQDDSLTINGRLYWQQDAEFFRNSTDWDLRLTIDQTRGLNRQAQGLEQRFRQNQRGEVRYRLRRRLLLTGEVAYLANRNTSENLPSRNFDISGYEIKPGSEINFGRNIQTSLSLAYIDRVDRAAENTELTGWRIENTSRFYVTERLQGNIRLQWRSNDITGTPSSLGNFELTDGAGAGNTWRWALQANYRVSELLRASFSYDGRTITDRPFVHSARLTVSAVF